MTKQLFRFLWMRKDVIGKSRKSIWIKFSGTFASYEAQNFFKRYFNATKIVHWSFPCLRWIPTSPDEAFWSGYLYYVRDLWFRSSSLLRIKLPKRSSTFSSLRKCLFKILNKQIEIVVVFLSSFCKFLWDPFDHRQFKLCLVICPDLVHWAETDETWFNPKDFRRLKSTS